jgi:hypothetical protein
MHVVPGATVYEHKRANDILSYLNHSNQDPLAQTNRISSLSQILLKFKETLVGKFS